jgi:GT2 family glycosyltransferase
LKPILDVLIVTYQAGQLLEDCIDGLMAQTTAPGSIVVVVSSGVNVEQHPNYTVVRTNGDADFAPAANVGLRTLGERPVVLLNDDTVPTPTFLEELSAAIDGPGIYQPRILLPDGSVDNTGHHVFVDGFNLARDRGSRSIRKADICGAFSGAAVLFTPEILHTVGLFDEDFEAFGEDLDLSLRAIRHGFTIRHVPTAVIQHRLGASYGRTSPRKIFLVERNRTRAAIRSLPFPALAALPASTAARFSVLGVAAIMGQGLGSNAGWRGAAAAVLGAAVGAKGFSTAWSKRKQDQTKWLTGEADMWRHLRHQRPRISDLWGPSITSV